MPTIGDTIDPDLLAELRRRLSEKAGLDVPVPPESEQAPVPDAAPPVPPPADDTTSLPPPSPREALAAAQQADLRANLFRKLGDAGRQIGAAFGNVPFRPSEPTAINTQMASQLIGVDQATAKAALDQRLKEAQAKQAEAHAAWWDKGGYRGGATHVTVNDGNRADVVRILSRIDPRTDYDSMTNGGLEVAFNSKAQLASAGTNEAKAGLARAAGERAEKRSQEATARSKDKALEALDRDLDPNKGRSGVFGDYQKQVFQADRLLALTTGGYNLDNRQINEFAIGLNKLLSGSSAPAQKQVEHLVPKTVWSDAAKLKEYITNNPQGVSAQEFVQRMEETIKRERDIAAKGIRDTQIQRLPRHKDTIEKYPEAKARVEAAGLDLTNFDENLRPKKTAAPVAAPKATHRFNPETGKIEAIGG